MQILIFHMDGRKFALDLAAVQRILMAAEYTPIPNSLEYVLGALNVHGEIIPVINMRKLLEITPKEIAATDMMILTIVHEQKVALLVDKVNEVKNCPDIMPSSSLQCILKEEEEITLFCDLDRLIPNHLLTIT